MGLFDKKFCDVCGEKIGFLGNRKLADGNLCKNCAGKLSPFMTDRRQSTLEEIKEHLAYREENQEKVEAFTPTRVIDAKNMTLYFNEDSRQWLAARQSNYKDENPDVMDFSQVTGCAVDVDESRTEIKRRLPDGKMESYNPPRYNYSYTFNMTVHVNSPYFEEICFKVNNENISQRGGIAYREAQAKADEIRAIFTAAQKEVREEAAAAAAPKKALVCPCCGATTFPDAAGCCEYCGSPLK